MIPTLLESGILAFFFILNFESFGNRNSATMKKKKIFLSMFIITKSSIKY